MSHEHKNNPWIKRQQSEYFVDSLEASLLPPSIEDAGAEYLADMAFDDRLIRKIAETSPLITSSFVQTITTHREGVASRYFRANDSIENEIVIDDDTVEMLAEDAFSFTIESSIKKLEDSLALDVIISPKDNSDISVKIQSAQDTPDVYFVTCTENETLRDVDIIDTNDLFQLLCQLGGAFNSISQDEYASVLEAFSSDTSQAQRIIVSLWEQISEAYGTKTAVHKLEREVTSPSNPTHPESISLTYTEIDDKDSSKIELQLAHTTLMPELDALEVHQLQLLFASLKDETLSQKEAKKVISSGVMSLTDINATTISGGRVTKLDLKDSPVVELFVDWFDEVVSDVK